MIFLDVDGVICNWTLGFSRVAKIPESKFPTGGHLEFDWAKEVSKPRSIWSYDLDEKFWCYLPPFPYAREFVHMIEWYDPKFRFLTSAPQGDVKFWSARARWIQRELGSKYLDKLIICCLDKSFCPDNGEAPNILIDDKPKNLHDFREQGGAAFHWKEINGLLYSHASVDRYLHQKKELEELLSVYF